MQTFLTQIDAMRSLTKNWDSYGADPPDQATLRDAAEFLRSFVASVGLDEPQVAPSRVGGVGAFWEIGRHELELEFQPAVGGTRLTYVMEDMGTGETVKGEFQVSAAQEVRPFALHALARAIRENSPRVAV